MSIITLTTDFGASSPYVAIMKGVILSINPSATLVDVTHAVPPQDVHKGAIVLDDVARHFPPNTVHVAVVDPGVGTDRAILGTRIEGQYFVAPDNGVLSKLTHRTPPEHLVRLTNPRYWLAEVSNTFHGRDIMAPVAAHLSLGVDLAELGEPYAQQFGIAWHQPTVSRNRVDGMVIDIDSFGNLITNIPLDLLMPYPSDERACVVCHIYETYGIFSTYASRPSGTLVALIGSHRNLELAIVGENAADRLGIETGQPVTVAWDL